MGDSRSFGSEKRLTGKEFRDGPVGEMYTDIYRDVDEAFNSLEGELDSFVGTSVGPACATIAALKAINPTTSGYTTGYMRLVEDIGAAMPDVYIYASASAEPESLPEIVAPTAGSGRWYAYGTGALKAYFNSLYDAFGAAAAAVVAHNGAFTHADIAVSTAALTTLPSKGSIPVALLYGAGVFSVGDHVDIGADVYTCAAVPANPFEFAPGLTRDEGFTNLVATANGAFGTTPTENVLLTNVGGGPLVCSGAGTPMGTATAGVTGSIALAVTITGPSTAAWSVTNMNEMGSDPSIRMAHGTQVITAELAAAILASAGPMPFAILPFALTAASMFQVSVVDSTGVVRTGVTDLFALDPTMPGLTIDQDGATNVVVTDVIHWLVIA